MLTPMVLLVAVLFLGSIYIGWFLFRPIGFGLEDVSFFASEIKLENFRVNKSLSDYEIESLFCNPEEIQQEHLELLGIILFESRDNTIFFRKEYCICEEEGISKLFIVFDSMFLMIPYMRSVHYTLLRSGFKKVSSEELFCDKSLEFLKDDNAFYHEDIILNFMNNKNEFLVADRFDMLSEIQQLLENSYYEIESGKIIPKMNADGNLNYKDGYSEKGKNYYFPF